jgi:CYTH domain-containing protein
MVDRRPGEGRYAHVEREQRWLLPRIPDGARRSASIADRYLVGTRLRLRRVDAGDGGVVFKLGQKVRADPSDPELVKITNVYLSADEHSVLAALAAAELGKTRWVLPLGGRAVAVDQLHGRLDGLVLAEVELEVGEDRMPLPSFAASDVTNDDRFSGGALAFADDDQVRALLAEVRATIGR